LEIGTGSQDRQVKMIKSCHYLVALVIRVNLVALVIRVNLVALVIRVKLVCKYLSARILVINDKRVKRGVVSSLLTFT